MDGDYQAEHRRYDTVRRIAALLCITFAAASASEAHAGRFQSLTEKFKQTPDQAQVVAASLLGGSGTEWLVGGGFQPDGSVIAVGTTLGPTLELSGKAIRVLGVDTVAPKKPEQAVQKDNKGNPQLNKEGQPKLLPFSWQHENGTVFVAQLSGDLKTVKSAARFPWATGAATSAVVGDDGAIYVAGVCSAGDAKQKAISKDLQTLPPATGESKLPVRTVFLAKVKPDLSEVAWVRTATGPATAPRVRINKQKHVQLEGVTLTTFDAAGKMIKNTVIPGGIGEHIAVNPVDGTYAYGHEHHWPTGREPWRCPELKISKPSGELLYHLYDWGGPYVGLNNSRLVSDTAIRQVEYDDNGNLVLGAWSDGGNSVFLNEPNDMRTASDNMQGLGMSAWGAGVLSCAYIARIDTKDYKIMAGTLWLAFLADKDKPNSIWIKSLDFAGDGSVLVGGNAASGLIQTGNHLNRGEGSSGQYVAVMNKDMTSLRFSSVLSACGKTDINNGRNFMFARGTVNGKPRVLVFSGAESKEGNSELTAPVVGGAQTTFGGGQTDGHLLLLDLGGK